MKKLTYLLGLLIITGFLFTACTEDDEPQDLTPTLTFQTGDDFTSADVTITQGDSIVVGVVGASNSISQKKLSTFRLYMIVDNNTQPDIVKVEDINETTFSQAYSIIFDDVLSGKLYAEITDKDGLTKSISFNLIVEEGTTPLQAEEAFEWKRVGGDDATGLDMFGLKWTWNGKAVNAKIEKDGADKFVQLAAADWTNFETVEDLMAAVEAGDNIDVYEGVSAEVEGSYDDVLATYYNGEYYIIHVEESTIVVETAGTTITISGNYKK